MSAPGLQSDLEPAHVARRTYASRRQLSGLDSATVICLMIVLLMGIPAAYIVPGMTEIGRPALIVGLLLGCWWMLARSSSHLVVPGPQPIRWALFIYAVSMFASYAIAQTRALTSIEANGADRALLYLLVFAGVALAAADGIATWSRLDLVLRVLVFCGVFMGVIALIQFVIEWDPVQYLAIPGLEARYDALGFEHRGSEVRVASTATHYIELATTLVTVLPFAIHLAFYGRTVRERRWAGAGALLIAGGMLATISRSGIVGAIIVGLVLLPVWTWRRRYNVAVIVVAGLAVLAAARPSLLRTFTSLFTDAAEDSSIQVRQERYPMVWHYVSQSPWLGRGTGTYQWPQYQFLDNWWLAFLITNGILGVLALAAMHIIGVVIAVKAGRRGASERVRHLGALLASTQLVAIVVAGTYDSMAFLTYATLVALCLGLCGTVWRLTHPAREVRTALARGLDGGEVVG